MHHVMSCRGQYPVRPAMPPEDLASSWMRGSAVKPPAKLPLVYTLSGDREGTPKHLYDEHSVPLMSGLLRRALEAAGVDNIQYFPATLLDPMSGTEIDDYWAFNIVGVVAFADMEKSRLMGTTASRMGDADFDSLVLRDAPAFDMPLFRLAESVSAIVVSDRVRDAVLAAGVPGMVFYDPGTWSG